MTHTPSQTTCWRAAEEAHNFLIHRARFEGGLKQVGEDGPLNEVAMALHHAVGWLLALDAVAALLPEVGPGPFDIDREPDPARIMMTLPRDGVGDAIADLRALGGRVECAFRAVHSGMEDLEEQGELPQGAMLAFELSGRIRYAGATQSFDGEIPAMAQALGAPEDLGEGLRSAVEAGDVGAIDAAIAAFDAWASASLD